jgi:hypothetical protein
MWSEHVAGTGKEKSVYMQQVRKTKWSRLLVSIRDKQEDDIKMSVKELLEGLEWIYLNQDRNKWRGSFEQGK